MFEISFEDTIFEDKNHEELVISGYESTCEKEGLTDGIICKNCSIVLVEQKIIPKKDHVYSEWIQLMYLMEGDIKSAGIAIKY